MIRRRRRMRPHIPVPLIRDGLPPSGDGVVSIVYYHPPAELSPNSTASHRAKIDPRRIYKNAIEMTVREVMGYVPHGCPWPKATMEIHWYHATYDAPDDDNVIGWLKCARDGATNAGLLKDDQQMKCLGVTFFKDPTCPRVVLIFRRAT